MGIPAFVATVLPRIGKRNRRMLNLSSVLSSLRPSPVAYHGKLEWNPSSSWCPRFSNVRSMSNISSRNHKLSAKSTATLERKSFWRDLYHNGNDVFTLPEVNPNLVKYLTEILPSDYTVSSSSKPTSFSSLPKYNDDFFPKILVPGCGRDISMFWLAKQGIGVIGIDYVGEPLRIFGNDFGGLVPISEETNSTAYQIMQYPKIILIHGDILQLDVPNIYGGTLDGVWDRGSLTSIAADDRSLYLQQLNKSLRSNGKILLEYLSSNIPLDGALDSVTVQKLLEENGFAYRLVSRTNVRSLYPDFNPPGLAYLDEMVVIGTKRE